MANRNEPADRDAFLSLLSSLCQEGPTGGTHTPPEARLLLAALVCLLTPSADPLRVLETGYDAGVTLDALSLMPGVEVVGIDDLSEYGWVDNVARVRLDGRENVTLLYGDALRYMRGQPAESFDLIFIDDDHTPSHVRAEAKEAARLLRPGGVAAFHDTKRHRLWAVMFEVFQDWQKIELPCYSPPSCEDYGLGLARKPEK